MTDRGVLGIDPGASGAVALLKGNDLFVWDCPVFKIKGRVEINVPELARIIDTFADAALAVIEQVSAMPKQGVSSSFKFGTSYGIAQGIVAAQFIPLRFVVPRVWKSYFKLSGDKEESRRLASRLWPERAGDFARVKDDGRAEAALLARWGAENVSA